MLRSLLILSLCLAAEIRGEELRPISQPKAEKASAVSIGELRCEYFRNPIGIDEPRPRLSWTLISGERGQRQTAYQVLVASTAETLARDEGDLWDSGRCKSEQSVHVEYAGKPLQSRQTCHWKVRVWDRDGRRSEWSVPATWSMGLLRPEDWKGGWIASDLELFDYQKTLRALPDFGMEPETQIWSVKDEYTRMASAAKEAPAVWMRKEFPLPRVPRRATAHICGLGTFELYINGKRISDHYLDPAYTDYQKRALYLTHDVTAALQQGDNAIGVVLGNGWFNLITPHALRYYAADYIAPPRLLMNLDIEYSDGTRQTIATGPDWKCTTDGPIRFNCVLAGETYDARKELTGWDRPGYDDKQWKPARTAEKPAGRLVAQHLAPVRKVREIPAVSVRKQGEAYRFDLGVDTVGWARIRVSGRPGQKIRVHHLGAGGHTFGRYQTEEYILKGEGVETFEPRFCYNGFRYVDVSGLEREPAASDLVGQMVCSDLPTVGEFSCSHEKLNRLQNILLTTIRNYILHIPNDPTREKAGWTQDIETDFDETVYNFDAAATFLKWQRDFLDIQHENGYVPPVAPSRFDGPTINGPWWGGVIVYAPWKIYEFYGDTRILAESYPAMKKYLAYLGSIADKGIVKWGLGDWLEVKHQGGRPTTTPVPLTSTAAYYWFATISSRTAGLLGIEAEREQYARLAGDIRAAYNREFFNPQTGVYATGSQGCQLVSLRLGLVPEDKRALVKQRLVDAVAKADYHVSTGFVATPMLLTGLSDLGHPDLAYRMATQETFPGWIDMVFNHGNTVMKEMWDGGAVQMPSLAGPIGTWFYYSLAGIRPDPSGVGFKKVIIKPDVVGDLTWAKGRFRSLYGDIVSDWRRDGGTLTLNVEIPVNTTATVFVPTGSLDDVRANDKPLRGAAGIESAEMNHGAAVLRVGSGKYRFTSSMPETGK